MESYMFSYFLPILSVLTILFIIVAYIGITSSRKTARHIESTSSHLSYTKKSLDNVQSGISGINTKIDDHLLPALQEVYKSIGEGGILLEANNIIDALAGIGLDNGQKITDDENIIGVGIDTGDEKVTFFFYLDDDKTELLLMSFSIAVTTPSIEFISDLMQLNAHLKYGCIGIRKYGDKHVVIVDQPIRARKKRIDKEELEEYVQILASIQSQLIKLAEQSHQTYQTMLMSEFAKLSNENKDLFAPPDGNKKNPNN